MRITEAAQKVQRSGFPEAYEDHAPDGRALASALTGNSPGRFSCVVHAATGVQRETSGSSGLTPRAERVRTDLADAFGDLPQGGANGRAFDVLVASGTQPDRRRGWAVASYLVAHASRLDIKRVAFDGRVWTAGQRSEHGWRADSGRDEHGSGARRGGLRQGDVRHLGGQMARWGHPTPVRPRSSERPADASRCRRRP